MKDVRQVIRRDHELISTAQDRYCDPRAAQMVTGFSAMVVDQRLRASNASQKPGRGRRQQKRPVGGGENVGNVSMFERLPERGYVDRLTDHGAQKRDTFE